MFTNNDLVHNAIFLKMHRTLVVLFYHGQEGSPPRPPLPTHAVFTITATEDERWTTTAVFRASMLPANSFDVSVLVSSTNALMTRICACDRRELPFRRECRMLKDLSHIATQIPHTLTETLKLSRSICQQCLIENMLSKEL